MDYARPRRSKIPFPIDLFLSKNVTSDPATRQLQNETRSVETGRTKWVVVLENLLPPEGKDLAGCRRISQTCHDDSIANLTWVSEGIS